uniref:Uncharacterized protein n=1 Tax=Acidicaldus sp. TaxID=1872105 RepID=A0A8J4HDX2_9PROT
MHPRRDADFCSPPARGNTKLGFFRETRRHAAPVFRPDPACSARPPRPARRLRRCTVAHAPRSHRAPRSQRAG